MSTGSAACSVIIPCFNGSRFLDAAIASLRAQTRQPEEVIVVDDGSTDDSAEIARRAAPFVQLIRQPNRGESVARNVGLRTARGRYVLFLDADDMLALEALERLEAAVRETPGTVAVMGTVFFTDDPGSPLDRHRPGMDGFFPRIVQGNFGPPHCWYTPRDIALSVGGFREDMRNSEDWEFWGRVALTGAPLVTVAYDGALYRKHPSSQVATTPRPDIVRGRLLVGEVLAAGLLANSRLLEITGEAMFWSLWAMHRQARLAGVPASDRRAAQRLLRNLSERGPDSLRRSVFARAVRYAGVDAADYVRDAVRGLRPGGRISTD